jgi:glutathione S-transferase
MKLYYVVGSPNCRKVHAVLNHLNLKADFEYLDFFTGDLQSASYRAINPNGMVPALVDGDLKLWESNAIMPYLADKAGSDELLPRDAKRRADVQRWLAWELGHFNRAFGILSFETVAKPNFLNMAPNAPLVEWAQGQLKGFAAVLDQHMAGRTYASGSGITLADYALTHLEGFKDMMPFDWKPYANLNAYFDRMRKVEHWAKTAPARPELTGRKPAA